MWNIYNYLSEGENTLLRSNAASLKHDEVLLDLSIVGEPTHRIDGLVRNVIISGSIVFDQLKQEFYQSIKRHY